MKTLWYNFIRLIIKTGLFFYSKRIRVFGKENIPSKGAVLFAVNHPNGLIDPLIVTTNILRKNHYLVRAAAFKKPMVKKFLATLNLMPIYRIRDGASQLGKNQEIFDNCFNIFNKGETLMIFPEGSHNRKRTIRPLSKGFTRIVFGAIDKYPDLQINVIPVGLTYQNASYYPTKVAVNFGKPISVNEFYNNEKQNISVVQLKNEVSFQLKKLSVHIKDDENYEAKLKLYARTRNLKKTGNIIFEEEFSMVATGKSGLKTARSNKTIYRKIVSFSAGTYKVQVLFWDINTKRRGIEAKGFTVPSILKTRTETN